MNRQTLYARAEQVGEDLKNLVRSLGDGVLGDQKELEHRVTEQLRVLSERLDRLEALRLEVQQIRAAQEAGDDLGLN